MTSTNRNDCGEKEQTLHGIVEERKESTTTDGALMSHANNGIPVIGSEQSLIYPATLHIPSGIHCDSVMRKSPEIRVDSENDPETLHVASGISVDSEDEYTYTVGDIVDSNREGIDETDQIRTLEKKLSSGRISNESLFPRIADEFLDNVEDNDDYQTDDESRVASGDFFSSNLSELTRRYMRSSMDRQKQNTSSPQRIDCSSMTDQYYHNAAKIYPTQEKVRKSARSEDIESSGQDGTTISGGDFDPSQTEELRDRWKVNRRINADLQFFKEFVEPHKKGLRKSFKTIATYIMLPSLVIACILFYGFDNTPTGLALAPCGEESSRKKEADERRTRGLQLNDLFAGINSFPDTLKISQSPVQVPTSSPSFSPTRPPTFAFSDVKNSTLCLSEEKSLKEASISWWFLFIGVRQVITLYLAVLLQLLFIDFFMFRTRFFPKLIGTKLALTMGQSKGWPCVLFFWAILDMTFLFGNRRFSRSWLYYQNLFDVMNEINPSGNIPDSSLYKKIIYFAIGLSVAESLKRTIMANFVGQRVVDKYRLDLLNLIKKLLLVGDAAELSHVTSEHRIGRSIFQRRSSVGREVVDILEVDTNDEEDDSEVDLSLDKFDPFMNSGGSSSFMNTIYDDLDEWEEPEARNMRHIVSTKDVLLFRRAVEFINSDSPFSPTFGNATTREECAQASQKVFKKLVEKRSGVLDFDTLCKIANNPDGTKNQKKVLQLVRLFRPNRNGEITKLDFVKSVDGVYKQLKLLLANISSYSQIDRAYGQIANCCFYVMATIVGLAVIGVKVQNFIILLSSLLVSSAFMIGQASSNILEGILLILVRKPYDIGDKVCFMDANEAVDDFGPPGGGWVVENVDLYTTTVRMGTTREYATFTNGSLSKSRIINLKRSEKPNVYMYLKFTMDITQEQLDEFRRRIVEFVKDRPREWIKVVSLRCTDFETNQQYLKFALIVQHREAWQSFGTIQVSKSDVYIHALHLQKELKMDYTAPKLPVHLTGGLPQLLSGNFLGNDGDKNDVVATESSSRFSLDKSRLDILRNESTPRGIFYDSQVDDEKVGLAGSPSTPFYNLATNFVDGSLARRKGSKITHSNKSRDLFEEEFNNRPTSVIDGSILRKKSPSPSSFPTDKFVSFSNEAHRDEMKNKNT